MRDEHSIDALLEERGELSVSPTLFCPWLGLCINDSSNCVERFLDTSLFMVRKIEEQRSALDAGDGSGTKFT
jgi:hypothetical protein